MQDNGGRTPTEGHMAAADASPKWPAAANMTSSFSANLGMMARRSAHPHVRLPQGLDRGCRILGAVHCTVLARL